MLSFFSRGVLDETSNLIESVSEGFPSYSCDLLSKSAVKIHVSHLTKIDALTKFATALTQLVIALTQLR